MADRLFAGALLIVAIAYTYIAFAILKAPFQYDPLGPESWPQILGCVAIPCILYVLWRPDVASFDLEMPTWARVGALFVLLMAYAWVFQPLGFILSTLIFCFLLSLMLGAKPLKAGLFGLVTGVAGYFVCTRLLELNLPAGKLFVGLL
ncbi:MAG: tripartite tricarboxylate transporter TctB family protein [Pseudomonadota bacterium]|nr:tripartite tricarboxylate transporter TctB family protein [Pseudomonadota bacterium]